MFSCKSLVYLAQNIRPRISFAVLGRNDNQIYSRFLSRAAKSNYSASTSPLDVGQHNSLTTFLKYASDTSLSRSSTFYVGTLYEYQCLKSLRRLGFSLERTGGAGDAGVDLAGVWNLPSSSSNGATQLRAIVQCKALNRKTGPNMMRELEGTLAALPTETIGILCSTKSATKGVRDVLRNSKSPMVWIQVEQKEVAVKSNPDTNRLDAAAPNTKHAEPLPEVKIRQMLWNEQVERIGTSGLAITLIRGNLTSGESDEIALLWNGEVWKPESAKTEPSDC